jgi:hypothetical protein
MITKWKARESFFKGGTIYRLTSNEEILTLDVDGSGHFALESTPPLCVGILAKPLTIKAR